ncbi:MAG TPA: hypothetical protein VKH42_06865 [Vicinamibacterales bacterium]|nr:MAG: hypothetical protein DMF95_24830 [Acidobacteriota bacterium]HMD34668.1 hypothetical protein [Vicinamibacterales bacterium]
MTRLLRVAAIAIAVAGVVDPAITMSGATRPRLAVVVSVAEPPDLPLPGGARSPAAFAPSALRRGRAGRVRDRLVRSLGAAYEIVPQIASDTAAAIVIGDTYPDEPVRDSLPVATVTIASETGPNVRIVRVETPREVPAATAIHVDVEVEGLAVVGRTTDVTVRIAGLEVGRASHRWRAGRERWRAGFDVVPIGGPPWIVRVETGSRTVAEGEATALDAAADAFVDLRPNAFRVKVYEPRPSWATTFVRRALEADARFQIESVSFSSRGIAARTRDDVPLNDPRIDAFDVLIVGGLDRLSVADVRSLDRYMRERRGAVVLVPDLGIDRWPVRELLPVAPLTERLLERPVKLETTRGVASLEVSELLLLASPTPGLDVVSSVAGSDPSPVIVSMAHGGGRLFLSGAMDAWRFRAAGGGAFDRFWRAAIAGLAMAAPPPIDVSVEPPLLRPGERGELIVRLLEDAAVSASIDGDQAIRLHPEPEAGVFRGTFRARRTPGRSTIEVRAAGAERRTASRTLLVQPDVRRVTPDAAPALSMLASSHRGIDVAPDRIADLERFVHGAAASPRSTVVRHPMRSAWWMIPFAVCLSAEWWMRRRRGLR